MPDDEDGDDQPENEAPRVAVGDRGDVVGSDRDDAADRRDDAGDARDVVGSNRDNAADRRDAAADRRDAAADERDLAGRRRDEAADRRDAAADERDRVWFAAGHSRSNADDVFAADIRQDAAEDRDEAAEDRDESAQDRDAGADERSHSEHDRHTSSADRDAGSSERSHSEDNRTASLADRSAGASDRQEASLDALTGAYVRGPGLLELGREMTRARRIGHALTVAFVDVDHLKIVNDTRGHAAGDQLLVQVVRTIRSNMRAYDLLVRYGGDEFVCVVSGLDMAEVAARFALVHSQLSADVHNPSISVGFAALLPDDSAETLLSRADEMLYRQRELRRDTLTQ